MKCICVYRVIRMKRGFDRARWWNEEVQKTVVVKILACRKMLEVETNVSRQRYVEIKREAKWEMRRAEEKSGVTLVESWKQTHNIGRSGSGQR